ncbi:uncharacterized protein C12orf45 homolog [Entelurus aequoreus]|uniref:uncharacterized protein C12orf45 homolog n=1 Tax=Entelurus aequoreus TaxID=161455 RepID=UPI002B1D6A2A|nr:uncharacterized protein C12orf45 homolog [Entelurus aequoreus]
MDKKTKKSSSQDLLSCGSGGGGLADKLLLKPAAGLKTERVPASSVLERLHTFLPKMAEANEKLKRQMEDSSAGDFDIQNVEQADKVIEMDVALVQLSDSGEEEHTCDEDSDEESDFTEDELKLPGQKSGGKDQVSIQVVE